MAPSLSGKVCLVTGASRGIGKGIALQLAEAGATVYITGRTLKAKAGATKGSSLEETAAEIKARGGNCIPVKCDHDQPKEIESVFERIAKEQNGILDVLVNNAYGAVQRIIDTMKVPFWEIDPAMWEDVNNAGLRGHYYCTVYAARLMVPRRQGLIVNISSPGGLRYLFNVPYGVGKAAVDRMAADCGLELHNHNVAMVSLWPGLVKTELFVTNLDEGKMTKVSKRPDDLVHKAVSPEYVGITVAHLANDQNIMNKSGRILFATDLADEYGFFDVDGYKPFSSRSLKQLLIYADYTGLAQFIPAWIKIPLWAMHMAGNKF